MPLEPAFDNIDDLEPANPALDDVVNQGDDHLRGIKKALQGNVAGDALSTQLLQSDVVALNADDRGAQVTGQVTVSDPAPLNPDELTRRDYVDALSVIAGQGLVGGGAVVGNPSVDVGAGNGIAVGADDVAMSGSFTGNLIVSGDVRAGQPPSSADDLTRKDYVDAADAANQAALDAFNLVGNAGTDFRLQIGNVMILSGTQLSSGRVATVTFAVAFSGTPNIQCTIEAAGATGSDVVVVTTRSSSGFATDCGVNNRLIHWIAIGQKN